MGRMARSQGRAQEPQRQQRTAASRAANDTAPQPPSRQQPDPAHPSCVQQGLREGHMCVSVPLWYQARLCTPQLFLASQQLEPAPGCPAPVTAPVGCGWCCPSGTTSIPIVPGMVY